MPCSVSADLDGVCSFIPGDADSLSVQATKKRDKVSIKENCRKMTARLRISYYSYEKITLKAHSLTKQEPFFFPFGMRGEKNKKRERRNS